MSLSFITYLTSTLHFCPYAEVLLSQGTTIGEASKTMTSLNLNTPQTGGEISRTIIRQKHCPIFYRHISHLGKVNCFLDYINERVRGHIKFKLPGQVSLLAGL